MERQELLELAALYALNTLDELKQSWVDDHLVDLPELDTELAAFQSTVAAIFYSVPVVSMSVDLKDRLFQRISTESTSSSPDIAERLVSDLLIQSEQVVWKSYPLAPGVKFGRLYVDPETREVHYFVQAIGAAKFPIHRHVTGEEIVVLDGDLVLDGQVYRRGDRIVSNADTVHQPETQGGCILFLRTSLDDEILVN
ncbi:MAG: cupin-like domain-containing protein [Cyanobacteria bacterium CRU_2_1]|nr:cupin-like domain-containing protein [Cyanobacteria bacterium RU_5_0]NJR57619.1 cupin-like domain-containing protein [Cyanobacteria bacterium CRU_2_1]